MGWAFYLLLYNPHKNLMRQALWLLLHREGNWAQRLTPDSAWPPVGCPTLMHCWYSRKQSGSCSSQETPPVKFSVAPLTCMGSADPCHPTVNNHPYLLRTESHHCPQLSFLDTIYLNYFTSFTMSTVSKQLIILVVPSQCPRACLTWNLQPYPTSPSPATCRRAFLLWFSD